LNCKAIGLKYYLTKTSPSCEWEDNRRPLGATISTCFLLTFLLQVLIKTKNGWHAARVNGATVYGPPTTSLQRNIWFTLFFQAKIFIHYTLGSNAKNVCETSVSLFIIIIIIIIIIIFAGEFSTPSRALKTAVYKDGETLN